MWRDGNPEQRAQRIEMRLQHYGLILLSVLLPLVVSCTFPYATSKQHRVFTNIRDAVVHVGQFKQDGESKIGQLLGSGFFVDQNCTVVTAKHLLENVDKERLYIKYIPVEDRNRFQTLPVEVMYEDENKDLAFLEPKDCYLKTIKPLPLIRKLYDLSSLGGEIVFVGGFPRLGVQSADYPIVRRSIIASTAFTDIRKGSPLLLLDLIGAPGFSGSPVVLERTGEVIGVVMGSVKRFTTDRHYTFQGATPITQGDYQTALEELRLKRD